MESLDNYEEFRLSSNALPDNVITESSNDYLQNALDIIIELSELHDELHFNELLPHWQIQLDRALAYLSSHINTIVNAQKKKQATSAIEQGKRLKKYMMPLVLHQFHA